MAVVGNVATEIGDVIQIETSVPIVGLLTLSGFTDVTIGTSGTRFFNKRFRYSVDGGLNYTDWIDLTVPNIMGISTEPTDIFIVQYQYERAGTSQSGNLAFSEVELQGTFEDQPCGPSFDGSIFSVYFDCLDVGVLNWSVNVMEKLYEAGILPKYIERGQGGDDTDFVEFWKPITMFFAFLVELARQFQNFSSDQELLRSFLEERGLYFCGDEDLPELREIMSNFYREMQKRGTILLVDDEGIEPKGELLRLICKQPLDFFQLVYNAPEFTNWNVGNSSPLSKSTEGNDGFDLSWEPGQDFTDINEYPIIDPGTKVTISSPSLLLTGIASGEDAGIGLDDADYRILIDPTLDYILSFDFESDVTVDLLTVGLIPYTEGGLQLTNNNAKTGGGSNFFMLDYAPLIADQEYRVRAVAFNKDKGTDAAFSTNMGEDTNHLILNGNTKYVIPYIVVNPASGSATVQIRNLRFQVAELPYSHVYTNQAAFTDVILKNNGDISSANLKRIMREELLPANTGFNNVEL